MMQEWAHCHEEAHNQSPVAHSCGLLKHPNSFCRGMFKLKAKFDAYSLLYLLSHFECNSHTVHMLSQWHLLLPLTNAVKLSLFTHAHSRYSPWLSSYIDVEQTVLFILPMVEVFLERSHISTEIWGTVPSGGNVAQPQLGKGSGERCWRAGPTSTDRFSMGNQAPIVPSPL